MKDKCVICGKESPYDITTNVDYRIGYIDGVVRVVFNPKFVKKQFQLMKN
jgi:hypothetical protein